MAISNGNVLKRPKVVEESHTSDSNDTLSEEEEEEVEPGDVEIKEEVDDEYLEESNLEGESFTAFSTDEDLTEIKEEDEEEENDAESSANKIKAMDHSKRKRTKKVKNKEAESESDDSDDLDDDFEEGESEEDNFGDDESEKEGDDDEGNKKSGSGLANMMAKILGTKKSGDVILSKAKTDMEVKKSMNVKQKETFEIVDSSGQIKTEPMVDKIKEEEEEKKHPISLHEREVYRKLWEEKFRKRPSIVEDRDKERKLRVLATQGVVQLFSAIEKHRTMMQVKLSQCRSIMGREKVLESTGKEAFMDILKQQGKRVKGENDTKRKVKDEDGDLMKEEVKDEPLDLQPPMKKKAKWNVFSDNFYKEPTLQGWDQQSDDGDD